MAQNLSIEDVTREARIAWAKGDETGQDQFCNAHRGMATCDRFHGHNGKHAAATNSAFDSEKGAWYFTKIVRW